MFLKNQLQSEKRQSTESEVYWKWSVLQKCANVNNSTSKTHQFSASSLLHSSTQLLRCSLKDCSTAQISGAFKLLGYLPPRIAARLLCSGNLFSSAVRRVYCTGLPVLLPQCSEPWGWSPGHPASHNPERSTRNSVFPFFSLATGQALVVSHVPGCVTTAAWGDNYSKSNSSHLPL